MSSPTRDFDLDRFVKAQANDYATALGELRAGRKRSHWMWYVFPQLRGLGASPASHRYGITGLDEARAYLEHPVLGVRLRECAAVLLGLDDASARDIFGSPDDLKLRSSATLFACASPPESLFDEVLAKYFEGQPDSATLRLLNRTATNP
jgi:uncharacterized protein (DUF1810 family)